MALDRAMGEVAGRSVLDVGAGEGRLARELALRGARVVALDRLEAMLRAGEYAGEGPHRNPVRGDAMELPFADESFDVVSGQNRRALALGLTYHFVFDRP